MKTLNKVAQPKSSVRAQSSSESAAKTVEVRTAIECTTLLTEHEHKITFNTAAIAYRTWRADKGHACRAVFLFHRGHEYSARLSELAEAIVLSKPGTIVVAWDAPSASEVAFAEQPALIDRFVNHVARNYNLQLDEVAVVAHSLGAVSAAAWIEDFAPPLCALVLATPAFEINLHVPFAWQFLSLLHRIRPQSTVRSFVKGRHLTRDPDQARAYENDPLIDSSIDVTSLLDVRRISRRVVKNAHTIRIPTLLLTASDDVVVKREPQSAFHQGMMASQRYYIEYPGARHAVFHEANRNEVFADVLHFLDAFSNSAKEPSTHSSS
ncbi:MAG: alpha/beta hydrolase [Verrucomicrobiota bacterium]